MLDRSIKKMYRVKRNETFSNADTQQKFIVTIERWKRATTSIFKFLIIINGDKFRFESNCFWELLNQKDQI